VQRDNTFRLAALNVIYNFPTEWLKKNMEMEALSIGFNISDLWYASTIWRERGTDYPFSYNPNFTLRCTF
jgi:hypothetical protein